MPSFCLVVGCSNNRKNPDLWFCRVPEIVTNQGEETEILSTERQTQWLAAISRADLTENIFWNHTIEIHCTGTLFEIFKIVKVKTIILHKERLVTGI